MIRAADMVLVVAGVRPETTLAAEAGATLGVNGAIAVDPGMRAGLSDVFAAGDCVITHHRLLGETWLPLGTTAHKQGRVAGENALGGNRQFAGSLGTQVVKPRRTRHPAIWATAATIIVLTAGACTSATTTGTPASAVAAATAGPGAGRH